MKEKITRYLRNVEFDSFATLWLVAGLFLWGIVFLCKEPVDASVQFLDSWNDYLKSTDTAPQMLAYKSFLIWLAFGCAISAWGVADYFGRLKALRVAANFIALGLCAGVVLWIFVTGPIAAAVCATLLVVAVALTQSAIKSYANYALAISTVLFCGYFLLTGLGDYVYGGFWNSSYFSWHYGSYFSDTLKIIASEGTAPFENTYGILPQYSAAIWQSTFGLWDEISYIKFIQISQSLILLVVLIWLSIQYYKTRHWTILAVAIWFAFVYNGGSEPVTNATQSLIRRTGIIAFLVSLQYFLHLERRIGIRAVALHGLVLGILMLISVEIGLSLLLGGLAFWAFSEKATDFKQWMTKCLIFGAIGLISFLFGIKLLQQSINLPWRAVLRPFQNEIYHLSFGGSPLLISPLLISVVLLVGYTCLSCSRNWIIHKPKDEDRLLLASAGLVCLYLVYYFQRNALSSLQTALIPACYLVVVYAKSAVHGSHGVQVWKSKQFLIGVFIFAIASAHATSVYNESFWRYYFTKDYIFGRRIQSSRSIEEAEVWINPNVTNRKILLISPYYFQERTRLLKRSDSSVDLAFNDAFYLAFTKNGPGSFQEMLVDSNFQYLVVDKSRHEWPLDASEFLAAQIKGVEAALELNGFSHAEISVFEKTTGVRLREETF